MEHSKPEVEIYDTTLRDGSQGEGISFSVMDKLRIAERLDAFGVGYIEGGWPGSNPKDIEFFKQAKGRTFKNARLAAFGSTRRKQVAVENDEQVQRLLEAETPVVTIFGKSWLLHVRQVLGTTPTENLKMIRDTVDYLKDSGKIVVYDAEHAFDGYKDNPEYALATWTEAVNAGVHVLTLCDTNGGTLPSEIERIVLAARACLLPGGKLGIHTHNDIGMADANALMAVEAGAVHVQGTFNGYGERTGNCNLTTVLPNLVFKMKRNCMPDGSLAQLREVSQFVDQIANQRHDPRQPWVGSTAFAHKGGMHVDAVKKVASSFEHIDPTVVGVSRRVLVSELAGRSNILLKARELGFTLTEDMPELRLILVRVKLLENEGIEFEAAEASLALLISNILTSGSPPFTVAGYHVSMRRGDSDSVCEATIKVRVGEQTSHKVAEGDGPVNALDSALRAALVEFYPQLQHVGLTDYKVRIRDSASGTAAITRVLIESSDGHDEWGTVGASENIVEASLMALEDSYAYALLKSVKKEE